jgi:GAF domain-containing protein/anti-sigma regulatory factor (Ser/Thr protein kinase)
MAVLRMAALTKSWIAMVSGVVGPLIAALALVPFRRAFPEVDAGLVLVAIVVAVAAQGHRIVGLIAAVSATVWFDFFLIPPWGTLNVTQPKDVWTISLMLVISAVVSELAVRARGHRERAQAAYGRLRFLHEASVAIGTGLDMEHTAQALVQAAVPRFADFATVDLEAPVLLGEEPTDTGTEMRRVAIAGIRESHPLHSAGALITVQLKARGIPLGVVNFWRSAKLFGQSDLSDAEELVAKTAVAIDNARRYTRERSTALALQQSLLPQCLPEQTAVEAAFRYLPAGSQAGVGGDWFDVIPLSGSRVALVVGDVVGHGLNASATMGRLRTAVRTLADVDLPPDELLVHLDDLVMHLTNDEEAATAEGEAGSGVLSGVLAATCLYAVYDPVSRCCVLASAGHPLPVLVTPEGAVDLVCGVVGLPLGIGGLPFEATELDLAAGSLLVLYSNGLVTSRERDIDEGLATLCDVLTLPSASLDAACDTIIHRLVTDSPVDDIALLLARTRTLSSDRVAIWDVPADPAVVLWVRKWAVEQLDAWGLVDAAFTTELLVSELVTNAIRYGNSPIQLRLVHDRTLICEVSDTSSTEPHMRRARDYDEGGRGLLLVAQLSQHWGTRHTTTGKTIWCEQELMTG